MALHLLDLALQQEGECRTAATAALAALATATSAAGAAQAARKVAAGALDAAEAALAKVRAQHPLTPADVAAQALALSLATVAQRQALAALHTLAAQATQADVALERARRAAQATASALAQTQAVLAPARAAHEQRRSVIDEALTQPPLDTLATDAAVVLAGADFTAARARIDGALPAALRDRARARAAQAVQLAQAQATRRAGAQAALDGELEAGGAPASQLPRLRRALAAADAALVAYAGGAAARLAGASAAVARLAALKTAPLSAVQSAQLQDLQGTARPDAAAAEKLHDDAALALAVAAATLRSERTQALVLDPTGNLAAMEADATNHPALAAARTAFDGATSAHAAADTAYTAGMRQTLAEWQAEVPEPLWSEAATLWAAEDTLQALQVAPATLVGAVTAAEAALRTALEADAPVQRRAALADAILATETDAAQAQAGPVSAQAAAALRGPLVSAPWLQP